MHKLPINFKPSIFNATHVENPKNIIHMKMLGIIHINLSLVFFNNTAQLNTRFLHYKLPHFRVQRNMCISQVTREMHVLCYFTAIKRKRQ